MIPVQFPDKDQILEKKSEKKSEGKSLKDQDDAIDLTPDKNINMINHNPNSNSDSNPNSNPQVKKTIKLKIVPEITQDWTIERIAKERTPSGWETVFGNAIHELLDISEYIELDEKTNGKIFPLKKNIFRIFEIIKPTQIRVLLLGQDPYPQVVPGTGLPRAVGLSFSVSKDDTIPSSLQNIYIEMERSIPGFIKPYHGDISPWAYQGVFLLNMCLTVRPNSPGSHGELWKGFVIKVLNHIAEVNPKVIYVLLGNPAQRFQKFISDRATVLTAVHPSGRSANKGFFGSRVFARVNEILQDKGERPIDWTIRN